MSSAVRLGSISFVNSLPIDLGILSGAIGTRGLNLRQGLPAQLNDALVAGDLDISPVSAFWYAKHCSELMLLPDLAIGSESGVHSVLLFSRQPIARLGGRKIALTGAGRTTPALLEVLCRGRYGYKPVFVAAPERRELPPRGTDAILLIGDEALTARSTLKDASVHVIDLAAEWREWTGLPAVFAVWAVRRAFFDSDPARVLAVHETLLRSREWGLSHQDEVVRVAAHKTGLATAVLEAYFKVLRYDLGEDLKAGLRLFLDKAAACGLVTPTEWALDAEGRFEAARTSAHA